MGLLILEAIGDEGETLALAAGDRTEISVGCDGECATFDSDDLPDPELEAIVFDALGGLDNDWREHLRVAE